MCFGFERRSLVFGRMSGRFLMSGDDARWLTPGVAVGFFRFHTYILS
jgi:hypothetical protein